jgi:putative tricarboxylic transport membrane protein
MKKRRYDMRTFRKSSALIVFALLLSLGIGAAYGASNYPEKPIVLVVGSGIGSGSDILARFIAASFEKNKLLPQPLVVESKPGGGSIVSMAYVAGKKKDPYYLLLVSSPYIGSPISSKSAVTYKDHTPICNLSFDEHVYIVNFNSKFKSIKDVVDYAKANPESVSIGGAHPGGSESINAYRFEQAAGIKFKYVAFGGGGDAIVALLGGHIDIASANPGEIVELLKGKKVRMLAILAEKRMADLPDLPTMKDQGYDVVGVGAFRGIVAPPGIPEDARKVLEEAFFKFTKTEDYKKFHKENQIIEGYLDGPAFYRFLDGKHASFTASLKAMGLLK